MLISSSPNMEIRSLNATVRISYTQTVNQRPRGQLLERWRKRQNTSGVQASPAIQLESHASDWISSWNLSKNLLLPKLPNEKNKLKTSMTIHIRIMWIRYESYSESLGFRLVMPEHQLIYCTFLFSKVSITHFEMPHNRQTE